MRRTLEDVPDRPEFLMAGPFPADNRPIAPSAGRKGRLAAEAVKT